MPSGVFVRLQSVCQVYCWSCCRNVQVSHGDFPSRSEARIAALGNTSRAMSMLGCPCPCHRMQAEKTTGECSMAEEVSTRPHLFTPPLRPGPPGQGLQLSQHLIPSKAEKAPDAAIMAFLADLSQSRAAALQVGRAGTQLPSASPDQSGHAHATQFDVDPAGDWDGRVARSQGTGYQRLVGSCGPPPGNPSLLLLCRRAEGQQGAVGPARRGGSHAASCMRPPTPLSSCAAVGQGMLHSAFCTVQEGCAWVGTYNSSQPLLFHTEQRGTNGIYQYVLAAATRDRAILVV